MRIGELAQRSGVPVETLRYYEKTGLIHAPPRHSNGYRDYPDITLQYLTLIRSAKAVGFSLQECQELLTIFSQRDSHTCAEVKALAETKLAALEAQMQQLQHMHHTLQLIADACCGGNESASYCSILDSLEGKRP